MLFRSDGVCNWFFHCQNTKVIGDNSVLEIDKVKKGYKRISDASDDFLERLGYRKENGIYKILKPNEDRVAVFCHQGFGITWLSYLLSLPFNTFGASFDLAHSSVTILQFENNADGYTAPRCLCLSDVSHFYKHNLPMQYHNVLNI